MNDLYNIIKNDIKPAKKMINYKKPIFCTNIFPAMIKLRKIRNLLIGHATNNKPYRYSKTKKIREYAYQGIISRITIEDGYFEYGIYGSKKDKFKDIDLKTEIKNYKKEIDYILDKIKKYLGAVK